MRAAIYYGPGDIRIENVREPSPGLGEVKIQVAYNGICEGDLYEYFVGADAVPLSPHPMTGAAAPVVLGHEVGGFVTDVGPGVDGLEAGELVAIEPIRQCGKCAECLSHDYNLCRRGAIHGYSTGGGGLSDCTVVARSMVHRLPSTFSAQQSAMVESLAVAFHAVSRASIRDESTVAVYGGGAVGVGILFSLRAVGVDNVIVVEPGAIRQKVLAALGATVVDPNLGDISAQIRSLTKGLGPQVFFETTGSQGGMVSAVSSTRKRGTVVLVVVGGHSSTVDVPVLELKAREIGLRPSYMYCGDFPTVIRLMESGAYPLEGWVSTTELDGLVEGLETVRRGEKIKVLVELNGASGS